MKSTNFKTVKIASLGTLSAPQEPNLCNHCHAYTVRVLILTSYSIWRDNISSCVPAAKKIQYFVRDFAGRCQSQWDPCHPSPSPTYRPAAHFGFFDGGARERRLGASIDRAGRASENWRLATPASVLGKFSVGGAMSGVSPVMWTDGTGVEWCTFFRGRIKSASL